MTLKAKRNSPGIYLFYGEEGYLIREQVKTLVASILTPEEQDFNLVALESDPSAPELLQLVESAPFFGEHKVVLGRNTKLFQAPRRKSGASDETETDSDSDSAGDDVRETTESTDPRLVKLFADMPPYATLIFSAVKADKRRKIMKLVIEHGIVKELNPFRQHEERDIRQWVEGRADACGKRLQRDAMEHLLAVVGTMNQVPRGFLAAEVEKAALFAGKSPVIDKTAMEAVLSLSLIHI